MAEKPQCACLTKQNQRCKKPSMPNKPYCYLHQGCDHPYSVQPVPVPVRPQITLKQMVTQPKNKPQRLETQRLVTPVTPKHIQVTQPKNKPQRLETPKHIQVTQPKNKPQHLETLPQGALFEPLCQNLANQQRYGDLYRLMSTDRHLKTKCQPYLDQLIERLKQRDPDELLIESCYQHDRSYLISQSN